jgi:transketolase
MPLSTMNASARDELCINTLRTLAIDAIQKANSGHPGLPMGAAPMAYVLWQRHLRHNPRDPRWPDRDRFVLSGGHGSMLLYGLLHLTGYDLSIEDIEAFRQWDSKTPGHPEAFMTPGVEATTGPLGQGAANAVGMALAERALARLFNRPGHAIVDHRTWALVTDGDIMEGVAAEAGSLAGQLGLDKLTYLYDANDVTLDGPTSLTFDREDVAKRYEAYGWQVLRVEDGDRDLEAIDRAIGEARRDTERPSLIIIRTTIGFGAPTVAGTAKAHGAPLGAAEIAGAKQALGWGWDEPLFVPEEARANFAAAVERGARDQGGWGERFAAYAKAHPELAADFERCVRGELPAGWDAALPSFEVGASVATRSAAGKVQNAIAAKVPWLLGGDADLGGSTKTVIEHGGSFDGRTGEGRNIHFGVREHAMAAIANGMAYHGGLRAFDATFFVFSDYMRPAVRLAAMNELPVVHVWTHDSVGLGEDGPTHQPIEHLMSLRAMPGLWVVRPADAEEAAGAWTLAMRRGDGPTGLVLTRQNVPVLEGTRRDAVARGAYVVAGAGEQAEALILATGSEVSVAVAARDALAAEGVAARVVSMPCWEAFASQPQSYRDEVLPPEVKARVSIEAGVTFGWERWLGAAGVAIGVDRFGASAPGDEIMARLGLTAENVARAVRELVGR